MFTHAESDLRSFRLFTAQLAVSGSCTQAELVRALGISSISMKRHVKRLRTGGSQAGMGMACTRVVERVCAAVGLRGEAPSRFDQAESVARGGVPWALPALLANGLLRRARECFRLPPGFYSLTQVLVLLAAMAWARVKTLEQLRYQPAGEWGKLLGLDRIPEVRTPRQKVKELAQPEAVSEWGKTLALDWMAEEPEAAGFLYVDGHVRVYHGAQTKLPRRYLARQRACGPP